MKSVKFDNGPIGMAANLHLPAGFDERKTYPAIVVTHPAGGVKEQTSGLYAAKLAELGFVTLAFDASYQGESGGEPRQLENPYARVEDISAAIDYLTTLPYVDPGRIGAMGICAGGGYTVTAALGDRRIKAVGAVSAANYGAILRNGWEGRDDLGGAFAMLESAAKARTDEANGAATGYYPIVPKTAEQAPNADLAEAVEYYRTPRAQCPTSPSIAPTRSLMQLVTFDAFHLVELFLTQPIQIVAGEQAGTRWISEDLFRRAASKDKHLHIVPGGTHIGMYDKPELVGEAMAKLGPFFKAHL
ncbi:alpha/beta hydrolase [Pseudomonas citronellolis]|uniref:alpha/beta hydrolase n=1 Tax=Pseudomonas citronellolis TaxID=53408 RepID=UPI0026482824|nr:alpha/beta hydrolase [Pseudomonas citronellolis]MDN6876487.1 alpha/beta hydrolase [Pseudomonas citronellolis]